MKKIVKLNRTQLRHVLSEAIQGKQWGDPEPFAMTAPVTEVEDVGSYEAVEARELVSTAASSLGDARNLLARSRPDLSKAVTDAFNKVYSLLDMLDAELDGDEVDQF